MVVTYDISDASFEFYTEYEWENKVNEWRASLEADGYPVAGIMDEEVLELIHGEEMFYSAVPSLK